MAQSIKNGGMELAIFNIVGDDYLTEKDKERKAYLESLPKDRWIDLDENGMAITPEQAEENLKKHLSRFKRK